jgi:hypothetical protein
MSILWQEGSRPLVDRDSVFTGRICRVYLGKFIILEEPVGISVCSKAEASCAEPVRLYI